MKKSFIFYILFLSSCSIVKNNKMYVAENPSGVKPYVAITYSKECLLIDTLKGKVILNLLISNNAQINYFEIYYLDFTNSFIKYNIGLKGNIEYSKENYPIDIQPFYEIFKNEINNNIQIEKNLNYKDTNSVFYILPIQIGCEK